MPVREALFVVKIGSKHDLGTLVDQKLPEGRYFASESDLLKDADPELRKRFRDTDRPPRERGKDAEAGIDTHWGRRERQAFGLALLDLPMFVLMQFEPCKWAIDLRRFTSGQIATWRGEQRIILNRQAQPVIIRPPDVSLNRYFVSTSVDL